MKNTLLLVVCFFNACLQLPLPQKPNIAPNNILAVSTSDFTTGGVSIINLENDSVIKDMASIYADSIIKFANQSLWAVNRLGRDAVFEYKIYDNYNLTSVMEFPNKSNPQDVIAINNSQIVVSFLGSAKLGVYNVETASLAAEIDLSSFADIDGLPEANGMFFHNNNIYVTLQRLNRHNYTNGIWPPVGSSYLVKINALDLQIAGSWQLPFSNPISKIRLSGNVLYFSAPANMAANYQLDGGLVMFDTVTEQFVSHSVDEVTLGYEIFDTIIINANLAYVLASDSSFNSYLLAVNFADSSIIKVMATHSYATGGYFSAIEIDNQGRLFLADRNPQKPGIRIFDIMSHLELTSHPHDVGLPPFALDFRP